MKIRLYNSQVTETSHYPGEDGNTAVAVLSFPMTKQLAEDLKCRGLLYDENDQPRNFAGALALLLQIDGAEVYIGNRNAVHANKVWKFRVSREEKGNEIKLMGSARAHVSKDRMVLLGIADDLGNKTETIEIDMAQQSLEFVKSATEQVGEDGQEPIGNFRRETPGIDIDPISPKKKNRKG